MQAPPVLGLEAAHRNIYFISNGNWHPLKLGPKTKLTRIQYNWIERKLYGMDENEEVIETTTDLSAPWKKSSDGSTVDDNDEWPSAAKSMLDYTTVPDNPLLT